MPISLRVAHNILKAGDLGHPVGLELLERFSIAVPAIATEIQQQNDTIAPYKQESPYPQTRQKIALDLLLDRGQLDTSIKDVMRSFVLFKMMTINDPDELQETITTDNQLFAYIRERVDYYAGILMSQQANEVAEEEG